MTGTSEECGSHNYIFPDIILVVYGSWKVQGTLSVSLVHAIAKERDYRYAASPTDLTDLSAQRSRWVRCLFWNVGTCVVTRRYIIGVVGISLASCRSATFFSVPSAVSVADA